MCFRQYMQFFPKTPRSLRPPKPPARVVIEILDIDKSFAPDGKYWNHRRLQCFAQKGRICVQCGLVGTELVVERVRDGSIHVDLYGYNLHGRRIMMTVDHIIPKSKGGPDKLANYQPMCDKCNTKKGDKLPPTPT